MKTSKKLLALALLPGLALLAAAVQGQAPADVYTQKTNFKLPIRIDDKDRATIQEVRLYVKMGALGQWQSVSIPPAQSVFNYQAQQDGEYWFNVATVDRMGRQTPADMNNEPPKLIVVVDTRPPDVAIRKMTAVSGDVYLQCEVQDANLDPLKTKMEYLAKDQTWRILDALPEQPGLYRVPDAEQCQGMVRATVWDRANNTNYCQLNLLTNETTGASPVVSAASAENRSLFGSAVPIGERDSGVIRQTASESRADKPMLPPAQEPVASAVPSGRGVESARGAEAAHQMINSTHATLAYQVDSPGTGGVGRVEVWMTQDKGQTWKFLCEDPDRCSPVEIDLPSDGLYGLSLVVSNAGATCTPPSPGEVPDWWVEVKTSKPVAQITGARPENGALVITWVATDNWLRPEPVDLYYSARPDGPWLPIARSLRNDGVYRWMMPANVGVEFYVRMEVTDRAGNVAECQTSQPVAKDPARPKARVIGLAAGVAVQYADVQWVGSMRRILSPKAQRKILAHVTVRIAGAVDLRQQLSFPNDGVGFHGVAAEDREVRGRAPDCGPAIQRIVIAMRNEDWNAALAQPLDAAQETELRPNTAIRPWSARQYASMEAILRLSE